MLLCCNNLARIQSELPVYSWVWDNPLECGKRTAATPLKNTDCPSSRSYQLSRAPLLEVGVNEPFTLHAEMLTGLIFYRSYVGNHNCVGLEWDSPVTARGFCFIPISLTFGSYTLSAPYKFNYVRREKKYLESIYISNKKEMTQ